MNDETGNPYPSDKVSVYHFPDKSLPISNWRLNNTWLGAVLNLGYDYYLGCVRAMLRAHDQHGRIGLVVESFGYWDLRSAHKSTIQRVKSGMDNKIPGSICTGNITKDELKPLAFQYLKSTKTYKLCIIWLQESDFMPKHDYQFQYNGKSDYEMTIFLRDLVSIDSLFDTNCEMVDFQTLPQILSRYSDSVVSNLNFPDKVTIAKANGSWGNPNAEDAPYGPMGI